MSLTAQDLARAEAAEESQQRMLLEGHGVASNASLAIFWFRRAADQLDAEAMNMMGRCHENGWGTPPDPGAATHWYQTGRGTCAVMVRVGCAAGALPGNESAGSLL